MSNRLRKYLRAPGPIVNQFGHVAKPDPNAPSRATLLSLLGGMQSMIDGIETGRISRTGSVTDTPPVPRNVCNVCGKTFNLAKGSIPRPDESKSCTDCAASLSDGYTALKAGNHFAFVKSPAFHDLAGQILEISVPVMQRVKQQFNAEWKEIEPPPDAPSDPNQPA